jgi:hypothetical protein
VWLLENVFSTIVETHNGLPTYTQVILPMAEGMKWMQCPVCKESIYWEVPIDSLKQVKRFPAPVVVKHKDHYLVCYLDSHYQLADTEIAIAGVDGKEKK